MSTTVAELVTAIRNDYAPDISRTRILGYINRVQKDLFNNDLASNIYYNKDDDTFPYPFLNTTAGTLDYNITGSNLRDSDGNAITLAITDTGGTSRTIVCRRVKHVFIMTSSVATSDYNRKFYGENFTLSGVNQFWSQSLYSAKWYKVPGICHDRTEAENARFTFAEDPGTYDDRYYIEFYYGPIELTSETVPLSIDGDKWFELIVSGVNSLIQDWRNGTTDKFVEYRKYWRPRFFKEMNHNYKELNPLQMPARDCG